MKFTIAVSSKNGMPYLEESLQSIIEASRGLDVEILYEDACSQDGSAECAVKLLGKSQVNIQADRGCGDAINRAFHKSQGDVFATIGADDLLAPDALRKVQEAWQGRPDAKWLIGHYEIIDPVGAPIRKWHTAYKNFAISHFSPTWLFAENIVPNVSFFISRDFRREIGDFLIEEETLANDYDYFLRCAKKAQPLIIDSVLGKWRYHPSSQSGRNMQRMSADVWRVCRRHTRNPLLIALNGLLSLRMALLYRHIG